MNISKNIIFVIILLLASCSIKEQDISGTYLFQNKYIIDSLILLDDYSYKRIIISANNNYRILYKNIDVWSYDRKLIELKKFLNKTDTGKFMLHSKDSMFRSPVINTLFPPSRSVFGNISLEIDRYNFYEKIK